MKEGAVEGCGARSPSTRRWRQWKWWEGVLDGPRVCEWQVAHPCCHAPCDSCHVCVLLLRLQAEAESPAAWELLRLSRMINQTVGDAISGILMVELILRYVPHVRSCTRCACQITRRPGCSWLQLGDSGVQWCVVGRQLRIARIGKAHVGGRTRPLPASVPPSPAAAAAGARAGAWPSGKACTRTFPASRPSCRWEAPASAPCIPVPRYLLHTYA